MRVAGKTEPGRGGGAATGQPAAIATESRASSAGSRFRLPRLRVPALLAVAARRWVESTETDSGRAFAVSCARQTNGRARKPAHNEAATKEAPENERGR